jgi:hypothetical protein
MKEPHKNCCLHYENALGVNAQCTCLNPIRILSLGADYVYSVAKLLLQVDFLHLNPSELASL